MQRQNFLRLIISSTLLSISLMSFCFNSMAQTTSKIDSSRQVTQILHTYGLNPASPFISRIRETPASVVKMFTDAGMSPRNHELTAEERLTVEKAFAALPPLHQRVLKEHLRSITFLDNMPNTALTSTVNGKDSYRLYDITVRAEILHQNASEWLTGKERGCFKTQGSSLSISVEAGTLDAIVYVLMHEGTHVVDGALGLLPVNEPGRKLSESSTANPFISGVWSEPTIFAPPYRNTMLDSTRFRQGGKVLSINQAEAVYESLGKTPFASLYGTSSQHEDLAEYLTIYHFTQKLKLPFRVIIHNKDKEVFVYEPFKSKQGRSRIKYMKLFYAHSEHGFSAV
jgi:hypothetical protein